MSTKKQKPESQASYIRGRLAKKASVETILAECAKRFAKGKVTGGYIRWIAKSAGAS
jgi:ribosomal protein L17